MLVRRSQFASLSTTIMLNIHDFLYFLSFNKTWNIKVCLWYLKLIREDNNYLWLLSTICGWSNLVYNENHVGDLEIIRTDVGQTFPICFTILNIQHFCIFLVLTKPDVFQTLPICLNVRHNVQYSLQFPISWIPTHNTWCFAEASNLFLCFFHILNFSYD